MTHLSVPLLRTVIAGVRPAHVRRQFRGYVNRLRWVALDGWRHFRVRALWIVVCNFIGVITAASSLGGIVLYARHAESGKPLHVLGRAIHLEGNMTKIVLYGAAVALLGVFSGACLYYTEWLIQRTTREYERICTQRLLAIAGDPIYRGWQGLLNGPIRSSVLRLVGVGARWTAFAFRDMLHGILPVLTFLFAAAVLIRTDVWLTLLLLPVAALYLIPLYFVNRGVSRHQSAYSRHSAAVRSELSHGMRRVLDTNLPADLKSNWSAHVTDEPEYGRMMGAFYARMIADKRVQFLNTSFFVVCLFALFIFFGMATKLYDRSWSAMLTYLFALRYAISSLRQVSSIFIKFSKFLPEFRAYTELIDAAERLRRRRERAMARGDALPDSLVLRLGEDRRWNSQARLSIRRGDVVWVLVPARPTRFELEALALRLGTKLEGTPDLACHASFLAVSSLDPEKSLLVNALGMNPPSDAVAKLRALLKRLEVSQEFEKLPNDLDTLAAVMEEQPLSQEAQCAISVGPSLLNDTGIAFASMDALRWLKPEFKSRMFEEIQSRAQYVVFVDDRTDAIASPAWAFLGERVQGAIVMDGRALLGAGDTTWLADNLKSMSRFLDGRRSDVSADEEDLDEDEETDSI